MKKWLPYTLLFLILTAGSSFAASPRTVGGVTLGANISDLADKVSMDTALPLWRSEYLSKVSMKPPEGYRSGYVVYGNCKHKGRIVRVKLSYEDDSQAFYDELHSALTKRYGKPVEWRGNPFGTLKIWKWALKDEQGNSISVILERYEGEDDSFTPGNSIRLTNSTYVEQEKACFESKTKDQKSQASPAPPKKHDLSWFLPE